MTVSDLKLEASEWGENENHEAEKKVMNVLRHTFHWKHLCSVIQGKMNGDREVF